MGFSKYWEALKGTNLLRIMCVWKNHMLKGLNLCSLEHLSISDIKKTEKQTAPNSDVQISEVLMIGAQLLQLSTFSGNYIGDMRY